MARWYVVYRRNKRLPPMAAVVKELLRHGVAAQIAQTICSSFKQAK